MKTYKWTGIHKNHHQRGKINAKNIHYARAMLYKKQINIVSIKPSFVFFRQEKKLTLKNEIYLLQQLSSLLKSGITLLDSIKLIKNTNHHIATQKLLNTIKSKLQQGHQLHQACDNIFDITICKFIAIGEKTGKLESMLDYAIELKTTQQQLTQQTKSALFYPGLVSLFAIAITFLLLHFVVPQFASLFDGVGAKLPLPTRLVLSLSHYSPYLFISLLLITLILLPFLKHIKSLAFIASSKLPLIRSIIFTAELAKFSTCLQIIIEAGIPILSALDSATRIIKLKPLRIQLERSAQQLESGQTLTNSLRSSHLPPLFIELIEYGEQSGALTNMLKQLSTHFQEQLQRYLTRCHILLEPIIMLILGVIIGGLMLAMYLPMFQIGNVL